MTPEQVADRLRGVPCPGCGQCTLVLETRLRVKKTGTYSLAGVQPKMAAYEWPYFVCQGDECDFTHPLTLAGRPDESVEQRPEVV